MVFRKSLKQKLVNIIQSMLSSQKTVARILLTIVCSIVTAEIRSAGGNNNQLFYETCNSKNFVMRWHYQNCCDFAYDPGTHMWATQEGGVTFNPKEVKAGNIIFVRSIDKFFKEIHPHIEHPYIIVSAGDSTDQMWDHHKQYLDQEKIIAWFGIHPNQMAIRHPKFHPIPLGIYQDPMLYDQREALNNRFKILRTTVEKKYLLYLSFTVTLNDGTPYAGRKEIREKFLKESYIHYPGVLKFDDYLTEAAKSYFTLSPIGTGPDCYRTWEALLVGSIPIVIRSPLDHLFEGLPVLIVDSWDEITEEFLKKELSSITSKKYDISKLYSEYWIDQIKEAQRKFLAQKDSFWGLYFRSQFYLFRKHLIEFFKGSA